MVMSHSLGATSLELNDALKRLEKFTLSKIPKKILSALGNDAQLHLVGGAVRDTILKSQIKKSKIDIDLATGLHPEEVCKRLSDQKIHWIPTGIEHGTVLAVVDDTHIEITTFRIPGSRELGGSNPRYSDSIEIDLSGRDFTINAIAYSLEKRILIDPFSGIEDLKSNTIRAINDPTIRFKEDPLRILRMVRFGHAQGRTVEETTWQAALSLISSLATISMERIRDEFLKILISDYPENSLRALKELKALDLIIPEIVPSYDFEQNEYHRFDVFEHTLEVIKNTPQDLLLRLTALFHDLGKPHTLSVGDDERRHFYKHEIVSADLTKKALKRLLLPNSVIKEVSLLVRLHMRPIGCGPAGIRRLIRDLDQLLNPWLKFKEADALGAKVKLSDFESEKKRFIDLLKIEQARTTNFLKLAITGQDLISLGAIEGPILGNVLNALKEMVLNDPSLNTKEALLRLAKEKLVS